MGAPTVLYVRGALLPLRALPRLGAALHGPAPRELGHPKGVVGAREHLRQRTRQVLAREGLLQHLRGGGGGQKEVRRGSEGVQEGVRRGSEGRIKARGGKYRSSVDAREPQNPAKSEEYQRHRQGCVCVCARVCLCVWRLRRVASPCWRRRSELTSQVGVFTMCYLLRDTGGALDTASPCRRQSDRPTCSCPLPLHQSGANETFASRVASHLGDTVVEGVLRLLVLVYEQQDDGLHVVGDAVPQAARQAAHVHVLHPGVGAEDDDGRHALAVRGEQLHRVVEQLHPLEAALFDNHLRDQPTGTTGLFRTRPEGPVVRGALRVSPDALVAAPAAQEVHGLAVLAALRPRQLQGGEGAQQQPPGGRLRQAEGGD
eukprot:1181297-Prorocentrum_minimum.AAC.1